MLYTVSKFQERCARAYKIDDLTMVVAIRAHDNNPWVKERLRALGGYYRPAPRVIVVDFGSSEPHRDQLEALASANSFTYIYIDDADTFCLAKARNAGASAAQTDLLFFSDIDCYGERDLCARLVRHANDIELGAIYDQIIKMPVYHFAEGTTRRFFQETDHDARSSLVARGFATSVYDERGNTAHFVDPSSNFFVCHRDFYNLVGGYNERFRGHGSEDYEFLLRFSLISGQFPLPVAPADDLYGPMRAGFYGPKVFRGFRRLGELMSYGAETAGLRVAHLFHGQPAAASDPWYDENDWTRARFHAQVDPLIENRALLLTYDWMPRDKTAIVVLGQRSDHSLYLQLREAGYRMIPASVDLLSKDDEIHALIAGQTIDAVAMVCPSAGPCTELRSGLELARDLDAETIVIERGALPESWHYGTVRARNDPTWSSELLDAYTPHREERAIALDYVRRLRSDKRTPEQQTSIAQTRARYATSARRHSKACVVLLHAHEEMAFLSTWGEEILRVATANPDVLFLVHRSHPPPEANLGPGLSNLVACSAGDDLHALFNLADLVITYNNDAGLLALLHGCNLVSVGDAHYNFQGLGKQAPDLEQAVHVGLGDDLDFLSRDLHHFVAWLLFRKYSFFHEDASPDLWCYQQSGPAGESHLRARVSRRFSPSSYASARLGTRVDDGALFRAGLVSRSWLAALTPRPFTTAGGVYRRLRKLTRDPARFFSDSRHPSLRWLGRFVDGSTSVNP